MTTDLLSTTAFHQLLDAATRAPSSHNTQPWQFAPIDHGVAVIADRRRRLPVNDPFDRELTISCGAAITNIEIAARHLGLDAQVTALPEPGDNDLLAVVHLSPITDARAEGEPEFAAIETRCTTRGPLAPHHTIGLADVVAGDNRVTFAEIGDDRREALADLVADGDRAQFADGAWRRELAGWMHPRGRGDGLTVGSLTGAVTRTVVSRFDLGRSTARKNHQLVMDAPQLIVIGSVDDEPGDWIEVGRQLERLLLRGAAQGCRAGYLNQPCQVSSIRSRFQDLVPEAGVPQIVVRIGASSETAEPTARRPIADVITTTGGTR